VIAALSMYDRPEVRDATDRLWAAIAGRLRAAGIGAPDALARDVDPWEVWQSADLLLAQTCGLPFRSRLWGRVALVATPDFGLSGCPPGHYRSVIVARAGDGVTPAARRGPRLAYNEGLSQSGWAAALDWCAARGVSLSAILETGSHAASAAAVAEGRADLAAIDAVTWRLLRRHAPVAATLREVDRTPPMPGLPLITARNRDPRPLAAAVESAIDDLAPTDRAALGLAGLARIPAEAYTAFPIPPSPEAFAHETGIPRL
jgi:ABC-type phosphate/phosphonate transport system substrate-binding protein